MTIVRCGGTDPILGIDRYRLAGMDRRKDILGPGTVEMTPIYA